MPGTLERAANTDMRESIAASVSLDTGVDAGAIDKRCAVGADCAVTSIGDVTSSIATKTPTPAIRMVFSNPFQLELSDAWRSTRNPRVRPSGFSFLEAGHMCATISFAAPFANELADLRVAFLSASEVVDPQIWQNITSS